MAYFGFKVATSLLQIQELLVNSLSCSQVSVSLVALACSVSTANKCAAFTILFFPVYLPRREGQNNSYVCFVLQDIACFFWIYSLR